MARKPMVTRTLKSTKAIVLCADVEKGTTEKREVIISRTYRDSKALFKAVSAQVNTDTVKAVHIISFEIQENLYGMTEAEFLKAATVLPSRTSANK